MKKKRIKLKDINENNREYKKKYIGKYLIDRFD